jgi:hypothetical protein
MKPIVLAMVLADHYYRDSNSGKSIITGTFNSINCSDFPTKHGNVAVYISLTDIATNGEVQLIFRKQDSDFSMDLPTWRIEAPEIRHTVVEIGGNISGLPLPESGEYEFVVSWNGMEICSRRLIARRIEVK